MGLLLLALILQTIILLITTSLANCAKKPKSDRTEMVPDSRAAEMVPEMQPNLMAARAERLNKEGTTKTNDEASTTVEITMKGEKPPASSDLPTVTRSQGGRNKKGRGTEMGETSTQADAHSRTTQNTKRSTMMMMKTVEHVNITQNSRSQRRMKNFNKRAKTPKPQEPTRSGLDAKADKGEKKRKQRGMKNTRSTAETLQTKDTEETRSKAQGPTTVTRDTQDDTKSKCQGDRNTRDTQETKTQSTAKTLQTEEGGWGGEVRAGSREDQQGQRSPDYGNGTVKVEL